MKIFGCLVVLLMLVSCGADGEPVSPNVTTTIAITPSGIKVRPAVRVKSGPVTVNVPVQ
jgi:hypothetical protein